MCKQLLIHTNFFISIFYGAQIWLCSSESANFPKNTIFNVSFRYEDEITQRTFRPSFCELSPILPYDIIKHLIFHY